MKQSLIIILLLVAVAGTVLWLMGQGTAEAPGAQSATGDAVVYVGLSEGAAEEFAITNGVMFRVVERDGQMLPTTRDFREGRINAVVEDGIVTEYTVETNESTPASTEPGAASEDETPDNVEVVEGNVGSTEHDAIIGLTQAEAEAYAETNDVLFRIGSVDGEGQPVTMDYRPGRITAATEAGIVTEYTVE